MIHSKLFFVYSANKGQNTKGKNFLKYHNIKKQKQRWIKEHNKDKYIQVIIFIVLFYLFYL